MPRACHTTRRAPAARLPPGPRTVVGPSDRRGGVALLMNRRTSGKVLSQRRSSLQLVNASLAGGHDLGVTSAGQAPDAPHCQLRVSADVEQAAVQLTA